MSAQHVRETIDGYLEALMARGDFRRFFAEDVDVEILWADQRLHSAEAAEQAIRYLHEVAFDAHPELRNLLVGETAAAIEAEFVATHIGEFAGVSPTGRHVRVAYSGFYDIREGRITAVRIYLPMSELTAQIGGAAVAHAAG